MPMIEIDGSFGEGGGQIVRTAAALSAVTGKPVHITKIRQGRPRPGLAAQHAGAILALAKLCRARTAGVQPGSVELTFQPGKICAGSYSVDIGTAGSITLLLQCLLPAMIRADGPISLQVRGGTDVQWSPTVDYFRFVFLPALRLFGAEVEFELLQRGYYPKGQGTISMSVDPGPLQSAHLRHEVAARPLIRGISHCGNLPEHVARRQAEAAAAELKQAGFDAELKTEILRLPSMGSGITLWSGGKGASCLGERGLPAEKVGRAAAQELIAELKSRASVDVHLADQLIPYLAMAGGSYTAREVSLHTKTNIWTAARFLDAKIEITEEKGLFRIEQG